ncbi:MAG: sigma 54-interacting transcriptional regulator [Candidatus Brocadiae bacterium]|nr:sigma 54-interacting transcriptional regulator [Candidatus Brocadiia bacterium]
MLKVSEHGTLFLDEISELDLRTQAILLKALEEKKFFKVGGVEEETSDFRLICASNKNLEMLVSKGKFREDLLTRIRKWTYRMPGLKERKEDIDDNVKYELEEWFKNKDKESRSRVDFHPDALKHYLEFSFSPQAEWKGNFRDLNQSITRMATLASIQGKHYINEQLVRQEIQNLKECWKNQSFSEPSCKPKMPETTDESLAESLIQRFSQGTRCLVDEIEKFLQGYILQKYATKKKAGEILYQIPGKKLSNPSSKFSQKQWEENETK